LSTAEFGASQGNLAENNTEAVTTTSSTGEREIAASMAQNIADRSQQHSSSARNRRATIVQEVWQSESEKITTRAVTNYNHMHALTVQYFEVVQMYRLRTAVDHIQRALYIPMRSIRWSKSNIERYRAILVHHALDLRVITALALPPKTVAFSYPMMGTVDAVTARRFLTQNEPNWGLDAAKKAVDGPVASMPLEPWVLPRDVVLEDYQVGSYMRTNSMASIFLEFEAYGQKGTRGAEGVPLGTIQTLEWQLPARDKKDAKPMDLDVIVRFSYQGTQFFSVFPLVLDLDLYPGVTESVTIPIGVLDHSPEESWLVDHLTMFTKHYSRAVWRAVDEADITTLLSDFTYEGQPVIDQIDRKPVAISGQYLVFAYHHKPKHIWEDWLRRHGFLANDTTSVELLPMPTGGVFAEAVQGRANSAEKLDLTRFWNWQDSPIPLTAPEIAAVQSGSRATDANLTPGQLQAPIVNNLAVPNVPDPQGLGAVLGAISNGNMFRDMSGIAETRALASDALQQAQAGATAAGQQSSASLAQGMAMHSQAIDKILSMFQDLSNQIAGAGFGIMTGAVKNVGSKDISSAGAIVNEAAARDAAMGAGAIEAATGAAGPGSSGGGRTAGSGSAGGSGTNSGGSTSLEDEALRTLINGANPALPGLGGGGGNTQFASTPGGVGNQIPQNLEQSLQVDIKLRVFIPPEILNYELIEAGPSAGGIFGGDGRHFHYDAGSSRAELHGVIDLDPNRDTPLLELATPLWGETTKYAQDSFVDLDALPSWYNLGGAPLTLAVPSWFKGKKAGVSPIDSATLARTEKNLRMEVTRIDAEFVRVNLVVAGANPLIPGSPDIDAEIDVFLWRRPGLPALLFVKGRHDGFPAYELYVNRQRIAEYDPVVAGDTPFALFPPMDRDIDTGWREISGLSGVIPA
ncbi:MAG TPA: hypothetical protein VKA18_02180, partial [Alphaproteobacteria bacterium]|nr:hypothetical protein [Alphaproteobacteria bacterium]